jgi:hypothetical protein
MSIDEFSKKDIKNIVDFEISNSSEYLKFNDLIFFSKKVGMTNNNIIKLSWKKIKEEPSLYKTPVDYYDLVFKTAYDNRTIKKLSYPNNSGDRIIDLYENEFDLKKWSNIVKIIYNKFYELGENADFTKIVDDVVENMIEKKDEAIKFKQWLKYYNEGSDKKYSSDRSDKMKKISSFYLPLTVDTYSGDANPYASGTEMSTDFEKSVDDARDGAEMKTSYKDWKRKFNTAWRRIDKILKESEDYIDPDKYEQISEVMHKLDVQIGKIRFKSTASDVTLVASESFKKMGFSRGADILNKFAQETAAPQVEGVPTAPSEAPMAAPVGLAEQQPQANVKTPEELSAERRAIDRNNESIGEEALKTVAPIPGPSANEYDKLLSPYISIDDASSKLEQIAGMLSDRRVIRYLAEFDIMLDKLGIASMFPELAEAQSKLIDSYSYGLTRVTKMLGMLSNNKAIFDRGPVTEAVVEQTPQAPQVGAPGIPENISEQPPIPTQPEEISEAV